MWQESYSNRVLLGMPSRQLNTLLRIDCGQRSGGLPLTRKAKLNDGGPTAETWLNPWIKVAFNTNLGPDKNKWSVFFNFENAARMGWGFCRGYFTAADIAINLPRKRKAGG